KQATCARNQAELGFRQSKARLARSDDDVAGQGQFETSTERVTVDSRNDRFAQAMSLGQSWPAWPPAAPEGCRRSACVDALDQFLKVLAYGECACSGARQYAEPDPIVLFEIIPHASEFFVHSLIHRIKRVRTV